MVYSEFSELTNPAARRMMKAEWNKHFKQTNEQTCPAGSIATRNKARFIVSWVE
jgi:hypothetical protein